MSNGNVGGGREEREGRRGGEREREEYRGSGGERGRRGKDEDTKKSSVPPRMSKKARDPEYSRNTQVTTVSLYCVSLLPWIV